MIPHVPDDYEAGGAFPFEYVRHFLEFLAQRRDVIELVTYDDLAWDGDLDYRAGYPSESARFTRRMRSDAALRGKVVVLIQHDVDSRAERSMRLLHVEESLGIPVSLMIFARRLDRKRLRDEGEVSFTEYPLELDYMQRLEHEGRLVVGYHSNAFEQALFDDGRARDVFERDVSSLRERFRMRYFSPHGGVPGPDGRNNRHFGIPPSLERGLRWVHNGASPRFDGQYSDGGLNSPRRDPRGRDLRDFVRGWRPGKRYRVLLHPQYYNSPWTPSRRLSGTAWYEEILSWYSRHPDRSIWESVRLKLSGMTAAS